MKVAVFAVEYTVYELGWNRNPIPSELRSEFRVPFFHKLITHAQDQRVELAVLPGGFFRTDSPGGIANRLRHYPPKVTVLVGCDNVKGNKCEVWVIAPNGKIKRRIPEAYIYKNSKRQAVLSRTDRRFQINNKLYSAYCCGDVIIDHRKFTYSKAAFVLAHYSAKGRSFTPSMRKLGIPTFLSHHVKNPYSIEYFAYNGKKSLKPIKEFWNGRFQGLRWIGRVYSV